MAGVPPESDGGAVERRRELNAKRQRRCREKKAALQAISSFEVVVGGVSHTLDFPRDRKVKDFVAFVQQSFGGEGPLRVVYSDGHTHIPFPELPFDAVIRHRLPVTISRFFLGASLPTASAEGIPTRTDPPSPAPAMRAVPPLEYARPTTDPGESLVMSATANVLCVWAVRVTRVAGKRKRSESTAPTTAAPPPAAGAGGGSNSSEGSPSPAAGTPAGPDAAPCSGPGRRSVRYLATFSPKGGGASLVTWLPASHVPTDLRVVFLGSMTPTTPALAAAVVAGATRSARETATMVRVCEAKLAVGLHPPDFFSSPAAAADPAARVA